MISSVPFRTDGQRKEIFHENSEQFPYICFCRNMDECIDKSCSWHWHSALEIDYVAEGTAEYLTPDKTIYAEKGEMIFINSNVLHMVSAKDKREGCVIYAHLFDMTFLAGSFNSLAAQKYILPVMKNTGLSMMNLRPDTYPRLMMAQSFLKTMELNREEPFAYELQVRAELTRFWVLFLQELDRTEWASRERNMMDDRRIKLMLDYIHLHFQEHLTLEDIASAANISTRECTRCFRRSIRISPVSYLNRYRIHMAAELLMNTTDSVLTVSEKCGFSSGSYFGRQFYEIMGCTPGQFRKR